VLGAPAQLRSGKAWISQGTGPITSAAIHQLVRHGPTTGLGEGGDHLQDRMPHTAAQAVGEQLGFFADQHLQSREMAFDEIHHSAE